MQIDNVRFMAGDQRVGQPEIASFRAIAITVGALRSAAAQRTIGGKRQYRQIGVLKRCGPADPLKIGFRRNKCHQNAARAQLKPMERVTLAMHDNPGAIRWLAATPKTGNRQASLIVLMIDILLFSLLYE
ncbi:hypothetical protein EVAR_101259_1 [Eumeta japonica]|uniref:Uncharacterized protein n=1 Tax=Eumeta variegata TaxID=151549 RepID=A0A4C1SNA6_EUMVA|nr:hypothetical protein EVAR_101259_1 [Eumeta japonica]